MSRTLTIFLALIVAGGCSGDSEDLPIRPGGGGAGGGGTGSGSPDAAVGAEDASQSALTGTVCPILDFRFPTTCDDQQDPSGVDLLEQVSGNTATSDTNGSYVLATNGGTVATVVVGAQDATLRPSVFPTVLTDGNASLTASVMSAADYDALLLALGVSEPNDTATIALYVRDGGLPASNVNIVEPAGTVAVYYDSESVAAFDLIGPTQGFGTVLMFGVPPESGLVDFTVIRPDQTTIDVIGVPASGDSTTFVRVDI